MLLRTIDELSWVDCILLSSIAWLSELHESWTWQWVSEYTKNRPYRVQFANIRKMVLCKGLNTLFTSVHRPIHGTSCPKSQLKSTCLTAKFGSFLDHAEMGEKKDKMWSVLMSNIWFLWFLQSMFLWSYLYQWCGFCWQKLQQKSVTTARFVYIAVWLCWKIKYWGHVATTNWLHWSPVSWYNLTAVHMSVWMR